jgi:hypothetical protein
MKIKIKLSNISQALNQLEDYKKHLLDKAFELCKDTMDAGLEVATKTFLTAQYDGTNDVVCYVDQANHKATLIAKGDAVTFIEFGTGSVYTEAHPLATKLGAERGEYGLKLGRRDHWYYPLTNGQGTHGELYITTKGKKIWRTQGNPPARAMYDASKTMRKTVVNLAKETFKT